MLEGCMALAAIWFGLAAVILAGLGLAEYQMADFPTEYLHPLAIISGALCLICLLNKLFFARERLKSVFLAWLLVPFIIASGVGALIFAAMISPLCTPGLYTFLNYRRKKPFVRPTAQHIGDRWT